MSERVRSWTGRLVGVRPAGIVAVAVIVAAVLTAVAQRSHGRALAGQVDHAVSGCFRYSVRTDHPSYGPGVPVGIVVTATNISTHDCLGKACGGLTDWLEVSDMSGRDVYRTNPAGVACVRNPPPPPVVAPDHTVLWSQETWDRSGSWTGVCRPGNCHPTRAVVPAGPYRITWHWLSSLSVHSDWFELRTR